MTLNNKPRMYQLKTVKVKDLKVGDLFFMPGGVVYMKYSDHVVNNIRKAAPNVMLIIGPNVGHHYVVNTEAEVYIYKDAKNWYK